MGQPLFFDWEESTSWLEGKLQLLGARQNWELGYHNGEAMEGL